MLSKRTALITGCSEGGFGAALVLAFLERGFHVFATARNPIKAEFLKKDNVDILPLEVTSPKSIAHCVESVRSKTGGRLDVLVNNAGVMLAAPMLDVSISEAKKVYDVNVWGTLAVTQGFIPLLVEASGMVVNITSIAATVHVAWLGTYSSSKAAQLSMSEMLRIELAPLGVRVLSVVLGEVESKVYSNGLTPKTPVSPYYQSARQCISNGAAGKFVITNESAEICARHVVSDMLSGQSGQIWRGGSAGTVKWANRLLPGWLFVRWMVIRDACPDD
ncbi:putative short-chain dehydrogenase/reductase [Aspergillus sclerotiicarbonarius CBS 121057]|uniref:Putative short-chain dehydrogenase/reductase n=1 Tax=Aspergillus sclerotiicarbonarius (strain CBS 121057 / IBT 28362) TaxID=1448318 RepID=A0A319E700_ASPSB|nr:putative short-chain dehydrogenase/reductase [Aspergillus sclerotiicarbonarius CBS 121057]